MFKFTDYVFRQVIPQKCNSSKYKSKVNEHKCNGGFGYHNYICKNNLVVSKRLGPFTDIILFYNYILFLFLAPYILTLSVTKIYLIQLLFCNRIGFQGQTILLHQVSAHLDLYF